MFALKLYLVDCFYTFFSVVCVCVRGRGVFFSHWYATVQLLVVCYTQSTCPFASSQYVQFHFILAWSVGVLNIGYSYLITSFTSVYFILYLFDESLSEIGCFVFPLLGVHGVQHQCLFAIFGIWWWCVWYSVIWIPISNVIEINSTIGVVTNRHC